MLNDKLTDEQRDIISKVEKLMRLAGKNPNEAEAAAASAKAMELLAAYNLDISVVDGSEEGGGRRAEEKMVGGFYEFERDLWTRVADLNFCIYWNQHTRAWARKHLARVAVYMAAHPEHEHRSSIYDDKGLMEKRLRREHRLVGRVVNIAATKAMVGYILQTIERLTAERLRERLWEGDTLASQMRSRWAVSYREGMAARIAEKLWDRRQVMLQEEEQAQEEARRRAAQAAMAGASTETAITLSSLKESERDANMDFLYGEGWSAKQAAARAARAKAAAEAEAVYTAWAAANPEEAAAEEAKRLKEARKRSARSYRGRAEKERDWGAYRAGYERAETVGIDPQAEGRKAAGSLK
jgi:hypothetical protein